MNICANVCSFMTPEESEVLFSNLFASTRPGGLVFLTANTPSCYPIDGTTAQPLWDYYAEGENYPGFGILSTSHGRNFLLGRDFGAHRGMHRPQPGEEIKHKSVAQYCVGYPQKDFPPLDHGRLIKISKTKNKKGTENPYDVRPDFDNDVTELNMR